MICREIKTTEIGKSVFLTTFPHYWFSIFSSLHAYYTDSKWRRTNDKHVVIVLIAFVLFKIQLQEDGVSGQIGTSVLYHAGVVYNLVPEAVLGKQNVKEMIDRVNCVTHIIVQVCVFYLTVCYIHTCMFWPGDPVRCDLAILPKKK